MANYQYQDKSTPWNVVRRPSPNSPQLVKSFKDLKPGQVVYQTETKDGHLFVNVRLDDPDHGTIYHYHKELTPLEIQRQLLDLLRRDYK